MNSEMFKMAYIKSWKNRDKFKGATDYLVEHFTEGLTDEAKESFSADSALSMAIGENLTKNRHLLTGVAIGTLGTGLTVKLYSEFKKRRDAKKNEVVVNLGELVEVMEPLIEIEKEKLENK